MLCSLSRREIPAKCALKTRGLCIGNVYRAIIHKIDLELYE